MKITELLITPNEFSRPQWPMEGHLGIVIHYTGNAGTSARFNRNYFEGCKVGGPKVSAHLEVDSVEAVQSIPLDEEAFHLRYPTQGLSYKDDIEAKYGSIPSKTLIGIELCHPTQDGHFEPATLLLAEELCSELCFDFDIDPIEDIIRHFDVTGKCCPKWFVSHPEEFMDFKLKVKEFMIGQKRFKHQREHWL